MPTTIEQTAPCRKRLRVEVEPQRVAQTRSEILKEFGKAARIPGFRPGKAPQAMVESRYAKEIDEELRKKLIPDTYREALKEHNLKAVGYPQIEGIDYQPGKAFIYTTAVDTAPEFALPDYKDIPVLRKTVAVKDEQIEETLKLLQDQQAEFIEITDRPLKEGDFAVINYVGTSEGKPVADMLDQPRAKTLGENKNFWVLVENESFLPGFCSQMVGAQTGEKRQVQVDFPADFAQPALAGKKATYFVDIVGIKQKNLAKLNDDFAKKAGAESFEKLKEDIRTGLEGEQENEVNADLRKQIVDHLLGRADFELPESLVHQETRSIVYDVVRENSMRGATKDQLEEKKEEILGVATKSARDRLRVSFILEKIAEKEGIAVDENDIEARLAQMAERYRITPERMKAQLAERNGFGEVEEQVRVSKTLDFLVANAKVDRTADSK